ncbi:MAG: cupin domain-containing protein [Bacteroidales bacterium]|nr:cupin domain-containing protein [Bacteroidales bacterium]
MQYSEIEKSKVYNLAEIIDYIPHSVITKTILRKATGHLSVMAIDADETLIEKTSPFDMFIQVIEGEVEIIIDNEAYLIHTGQGIIMPAHIPNIINANEQVKIILTVIKSGYEGSGI